MKSKIILCVMSGFLLAETALAAPRPRIVAPPEVIERPKPRLDRGGNEPGTIYKELYKSARLLDRRNGLLEEGISVGVLEQILELAAEGAEAQSGLLKESLNSFITSSETAEFKAEEDSNYKAAREAHDRLFRSLMVIKTVGDSAKRSSGSENAKAGLASNAMKNWLTIARGLVEYYPELATGKAEEEADLKLKAWYRKLRFIARRSIITTEELLRAAPNAAVLPNIALEQRDQYWELQVALQGYEAEIDKLLEICRSVAKEQSTLAESLAVGAVESFKMEPDSAGRSEKARDAAHNLRPSHFAALINGLAGIEDLAAYRNKIPASFAKFCEFHRPVKQADLELVLAPVANRSHEEMKDFVTALVEVFTDVNTPSPKGDEPAKKLDDENWRIVIGEEYRALDALLESWQAGRKTWASDLVRAQVWLAWAKHQLNFVPAKPEGPSTKLKRAREKEDPVKRAREKEDPEVEPEEQKKIAATDVEGYRKHVGEWKRSLASAADRFLEDGSLKDLAQVDAADEILGMWFSGTVSVRNDPAHPRKEGDALLDAIRAWIGRLPEGIRDRVLNSFAKKQLSRLDPEVSDNEDEEAKIMHERKFDFVETVASLAPRTPAGGIFEAILEEYRGFGRGIQFHVVPEGELYEEGKWADGAMPTFPVENSEFGLWFTLVHTEEARKASGGFRRYAQTAAGAVSADDYATLSETERTKYADDFKKYLEHQLTESFDVVDVKPLSKPDVRRTFAGTEEKRFETPLYYAVLRPKGNAPPREIPALRLDLDFPHPLGRVILPFFSSRIALRPEAGKASHVRNAMVRQDLDDSRRSQGELTLSIISESLGLPPQPHLHAGNLPPDGFELDQGPIDSKVEILSFPETTIAAKTRRTTNYIMVWRGRGNTATFKFPTYPGAGDGNKTSGTAWLVDDFMQRQGQIAEKHVPKGEVSLHSLPWDWGFLKKWRSAALFWGGFSLGAAFLLWMLILLVRRQRRPEAKRFPLHRPAADTPLVAANFLRRIQAAKSIPLLESQVEKLREDVERLENVALQEDQASSKESKALIEKWLQIAQERFAKG